MNIAELADYRKLLFMQTQERRALLKSLPIVLGPWEKYEDVWARFPIESADGTNAFSLVSYEGSPGKKRWSYSADLAGFEFSQVAAVNTREGAMAEIDAIVKATGVLWL
jgi:hypothetical protein